MKRIILVVMIVALVGTAAIATAGEKSFADDAGDSGTAPDLTKVVVSETNGLLVFRIDGALVPDSSIEIYIDADRDQSTGGEGDELWLSVFQENDGKSYWDADRWNGLKWETVKFDVTSQTFTGRKEIGFKASDAGLTGTFDFVMRSFRMVGDAIQDRDRAPDSIVPWSYTLSRVSATAQLVLGKPTLLPVRPLAGAQVTLRLPVRRADTGAPFTAPAATCSARLNGRLLRGKASAGNGLATCRFVLPKGTSGSTAQGSIAVGSGTQVVTKAFRFRIA